MSTASITEVIGPYHVSNKLGEGGMGVVYRAHDDRLGRDIALKVVRPTEMPDAVARARLLREAKSAAALNHPNICTVHEVGESDGQAYIAMELVEGTNLRNRLISGPLPVDETIRYAIQVADAIAHAHDRGIVHRDLKSANIVITPEGHVKILDFGLAKRWARNALDEATRSELSLSAPGSVSGTLAYMAPEQLRGDPGDPRSDVWALGIVLYEMLTGAMPYKATSGFELSSAILSEEPVPLAGKIPLPVRAVIERCVKKQPTRRYQHAGEIKAALEGLQSGIHPPLWRVRYHARRHPVACIVFAILAILVVAGALNANWLRTRVFGRMPKIESIAVLPLENLSGNAEQAYVVDGIHEALITDLSRLSGMRRVIARPTMMRYTNTRKTPAEIARELGVDAVMTGAVVQAGSRIRVSAQLQSASEQTLWADRYERDTRDILSLENDVVSAITRGIKLQLSSSDAARLAKARPVDPDAYADYLKGRFYLNKLTPEGFQKGMEFLKSAVDKDPGNALTWAGLADGYSLMAHEGTPGAIEKAKAATARALELDSTLAEVHYASALNKEFHDWDFAGAENEFQTALALNPNLAEARGQYAWFLMLQGKTKEQYEEMKRAAETDPLNPLFPAWLAQLLAGDHRYDEAVVEARKALELDPKFPTALETLGIALFEKGQRAEGIAAMEKAVSVGPQSLGRLASFYARSGRTADARKIVAQLEKANNAFADYDLAIIYTDLGDRATAMRKLRKSYDERMIFLPWTDTWMAGVAPAIKTWASEPTYQEIIKAMNLPKKG